MENGSSSRIIHNHAIFSESYLPPFITAKESQMKELSFCLSTAATSIQPINVWIYGLPGTGKTSICKFLLNKLESKTNVRGIYINCWENPTFYTVLDKITKELRILGAEKLSTSFKLERLRTHIRDKPFILFLDEIDQPSNKERNSILYNFCSIPRVGIVAICNNKYVLNSLDERIRSRLNAQWIEFEPYSNDEIAAILSHRAELGLACGSYDSSVLRQIAELSGQDVRVAIQTLKSAACLAEKETKGRICTPHIHKGHHSASNFKKSYILKNLTVHHKIIYAIIQGKGNLLSGRLWKLYVRKCSSLNVRPVASRTYSEYLKKLIETGLIASERAPVKGKVRELSIL